MKNLLLYILLLLSPAVLSAQENKTTTAADFTSVDDAATIAKEIIKASGMHTNFAIAEGPVPNAAAVLLYGQRFILYNPTFMNTINRATGTRWAAISVLAHEIGHHLLGTGTAMASEGKADEFSGYVLEKMGATLEEAQAAMHLLPANALSRTHPAPAERLLLVEKGWNSSAGIETTTPPKETATGELVQSGNPRFPYTYKDATGLVLYVHQSGAVVNEKGELVGRIRLR